MQEALAERLLAKVLKWDTDAVRRELGPLLHLARLKYDGYQQFSPGRRFIESLALWLYQFEEQAEREVAFKLWRNIVVYVSSAEMDHLVEMAYPDILQPRMLRLASGTTEQHRIVKILNSQEFRLLQKRTLYLGLSDGANTGLFRRYNPGVVGHEQTLLTYQSDEEKLTDLHKHLGKAVKDVLGHEDATQAKFKAVVLLDDFTASGLTCFRQDPESGKPKGKLVKAFEKLANGTYRDLMCEEGFDAIICFYVATQEAVSRLQEELGQYVETLPIPVRVQVVAVHTLAPTVRVEPSEYAGLEELIRKYFDPRVVTPHWEIARHDRPWLGYDECALPVILNHNSPNNSLPILWFSEEYEFRGLFPRTSRHT